MPIAEFKKDKFLMWAKQNTNWDSLATQTKEAFNGWSAQDPQAVFDNLRGMLAVGEQVISLIEKFAKEVDNLSNREKLDLAVEFIDSLINLPRILEWADQIVIKYVLSTIVQKKNEYVGKDWFKDDN